MIWLQMLGLLREVLAERGLVNGRIGLELGFVPAADFAAFQALPVQWIDCTRLVERLRAVKAPGEIEHLRHAAQYAAAGLTQLVESITPGMRAAAMSDDLARRGDC